MFLLPTVLAALPAAVAVAPWAHGVLPPLVDLEDTPFDTQVLGSVPPGNNKTNGNPQREKRFMNHNTKKFQVKSLPEVDFDVGEMYAGQIPVKVGDQTGNGTEGNMFFVFKPAEGEPVDELAIWLNGGPGCSSLTGFMQENGPFLWLGGTYRPMKNPYAWSNVTNMLWVDQPIGTGFSTGPITARAVEDIAAPFMGFLKNFQDTFGIKNYKIFMAGESYAGRYIPYISNAMVKANNTENFNMSGILMYNPTIGNAFVQQEVAVVPFVKENHKLYGFNETFMNGLQDLYKNCGYEDIFNKYLQFPPPGPQPTMDYELNIPQNMTRMCSMSSAVRRQAYAVNPCFNAYQISDLCPLPWDISGFARAFVNVPGGTEVYFDRADVKRALNAPKDVKWTACGNQVFTDPWGDFSPNSIIEQLPSVIDATQRALIGGSMLDSVITGNSTLLSIQNMTWGGQLGFQSRPSEPFIIDEPDLMWSEIYENSRMPPLNGPQGQMGVYHFERGLMWVDTQMAGHMLPASQPRAAYKQLLWLLGRIDKL